MFVLPTKYRVRAREIACDCWSQAAFHEPRAVALTKKAIAADKERKAYGNPMMALMVAYYIANLCYLAYRVWHDQQVKAPPAKPAKGEPFGLFEGAKE